MYSKEALFRMQRRLVYDTKKASLEMRDVVVGKWGMLQWEMRGVAVENKGCCNGKRGVLQ